MYSFHNDIAIPLEYIARKELDYNFRPRGTIFDADSIESRTFVTVMSMLLNKKNNYGLNGKIIEFEEKCKPFYYKNGNSISETEATQLFEDFKELYNVLPFEVE